MTFNTKHATPEFLAKLEQKLTEYRKAIGKYRPERCRLVQYVGPDKPYGLDISLEKIEYEISFNLAEGLIVDWLFENAVRYICTQEPGFTMPSWDKVKAEEPLMGVDALLRDAGFDV